MTVYSVSYLLCLAGLWLLIMPMRSAIVRQCVLLAASYVFYATHGLDFLAVLIASTVVNYLMGRLLRKSPTIGLLWIGIALNVLILALFKYLPEAGHGALAWPPYSARWFIRPIGVSFWTFQALSYLFDLYREEELDPTPIEFALYMSFWPTVLSGPVCRLPEMLPQFRQAPGPTWDDVSRGTWRITIGLFMKIVMAGVLDQGIMPGEGVRSGFDLYDAWGPLDVWMLAVGYGMQLYFDFAGYSHIVIGSARLFGIELLENFDRPYFSLTVSQFWTRWHMSLSFWIRDYLFLPLATLFRPMWWRNAALLLSMTLFGFWHGATWPFVLWGAYHGVLLVGHRLIQQTRRRMNPERSNNPHSLERFITWAFTFALICLGWVFFRSHSAHQAITMFASAFDLTHFRTHVLRPNFYLMTAGVLLGYFVFSGIRVLIERADAPGMRRLLWLMSPAYYAATVLLIIVWSKQETVFVYFQF